MLYQPCPAGPARSPPLGGRQHPARQPGRPHRLEELHPAAALLQAHLRRVGRGVPARSSTRPATSNWPGSRSPPLPGPGGLSLERRPRDAGQCRRGARSTPCARSRRPTQSTSTASSATPQWTQQGAAARRAAQGPDRALLGAAARQPARQHRHPRRRLRVPDREVRRRHQQEGRRVLHAAQRRADDGRHPRPARRARPSTTRPAAPAACCWRRSSTCSEHGGDPRTFFGKLYGQEKNLTTVVDRAHEPGPARHRGLPDRARRHAAQPGLHRREHRRPGHLRLRDRQPAVLARGVGPRDLGERPVGPRLCRPAARQSSGDFAWVQHMVKSMADGSGRMAVVLPQGALFRRGVEGQIRQQAAGAWTWSRPSSGWRRTSSTAPAWPPASSSCASASRPSARGKVLIVDASRLFRKGRAQNFLEPEHAAADRRLGTAASRTCEDRGQGGQPRRDRGRGLDAQHLALRAAAASATTSRRCPRPSPPSRTRSTECREAEDRLRAVLTEGGWLDE